MKRPEKRRVSRRIYTMRPWVSLWGWHRLNSSVSNGPTAAVSLVQRNIDQKQMGKHSLDTAFDVIESLVYSSAQYRPDAIILPESALLCYLVRRPSLKQRVIGWSQKSRHRWCSAHCTGRCPAPRSYRVFRLQYGFFP